MYANKFIACVKADGKVLREKGDEVYLPFGSEYTLYFKNENNRKVQINIEIDGQDVLFGDTLLLDAGKSMDLKGFVRDIMGKDNRAFKFITKTAAISDFRGDRVEDGLIKITYQFEKEKSELESDSIKREFYFDDVFHKVYTNSHNSNDFKDSLKNIIADETSHSEGFNRDLNSENIFFSSNGNISNTLNTSYTSDDNVKIRSLRSTISNDPGITVEGSATHQSFSTGFIGKLESNKYTMIFQLKGLTSNEQIDEPITVSSKKQCLSCGKKFKSTFEYCPHDGTFLRT